MAEIGPGHGPNFAYYPAAVTGVLAVEPEPTLRELARAAADTARREQPDGPPIEVVAGAAEHIPAADGSFDAVVATLVFCSVPDPAAALREIARVLRPGGRFVFLEHVLSTGPAAAATQRVLDGSRLWPAIGAGCHCARDTPAAIRAAGFTMGGLERFPFPAGGPPRPTRPHAAGWATRPGA